MAKFLKNKTLLIIIIIILSLSFVATINLLIDSKSTTVTNTVNKQKDAKNVSDITVTGKIYLEENCPASIDSYCIAQVYLVDSNLQDIKPDTPKIALSKKGVLISCNNFDGKVCSGYVVGKVYTVQGTINHKIKIGENVKVIDIR